MRPIGLLFLFSLFFLSFTGASYAQPMTLEECDERFKEHLEGFKLQHREKVQELQKNYLAALLRFESNARSEGNLQDVQAAREEIEQVEQDEEGRDVVPSENARIKQMQDIRARQLKTFGDERAQGVLTLVNAVRTLAENTSRELTQNNQIDKAIKWNEWLNNLDSEPDVAVAMRTLQRQQQNNQRASEPTQPTVQVHAALRGRPATLITTPSREYPNGPKAYIAGNEPDGRERRLGNVSTPSASGLGSSVLTGSIKLVEEDNTLSSSRSRWSNYSRRAHVYIPRLEFSPMVNKPMGRSLVVFDLFKRGTGNRRELIQTDQVLLPELSHETRVIVDAQPYEYETERYRSSLSNYRYDRATADQFYGYIVTIFNSEGELIFQRATERALNSYAREAPPR